MATIASVLGRSRNVSSPLGKYSAVVASIVAVSVIIAYLAALLFGSLLGLQAPDVGGLKDLAFIAIGAVFALGGQTSSNAATISAEAAHLRLDAMGAPPAAELAAKG